MSGSHKDMAAGALFFAVGASYGLMALLGLPVGEALNMGPGFFPLVLASALMVLGAFIGMRAFGARAPAAFGSVPWRAVVFLSLATIVFATFIDDLGMVAGVFVTALLSGLAGRDRPIGQLAIASAGIAVLCTAIFTYGIGLPIPALGPWFVP